MMTYSLSEAAAELKVELKTVSDLVRTHGFPNERNRQHARARMITAEVVEALRAIIYPATPSN